MVGLIALDEILRFFLGGVVRIAFEFHIGDDFLHDSPANPARFRIPFDVIAAFERLGHLCVAIKLKMHLARQWSREKRYQQCFQHHVEYRLLAQHLTSRELYGPFSRIESDAPVDLTSGSYAMVSWERGNRYTGSLEAE
jgi:hypothetical protein